MRAYPRLGLQIGAATDTPLGIQIVVRAATGTRVVWVAAIGTEAHRTRELLCAVRTIDHLDRRFGAGACLAAGLLHALTLTPERGLVILRLHYAGSRTSHIAHHLHGQQSAQQSARAVADTAYGALGRIKHLLLLPRMPRNRHGRLIGYGLLDLAVFGCRIRNVDRADIELCQLQAERTPEGAHGIPKKIGERR